MFLYDEYCVCVFVCMCRYIELFLQFSQVLLCTVNNIYNRSYNRHSIKYFFFNQPSKNRTIHAKIK